MTSVLLLSTGFLLIPSIIFILLKYITTQICAWHTWRSSDVCRSPRHGQSWGSLCNSHKKEKYFYKPYMVEAPKIPLQTPASLSPDFPLKNISSPVSTLFQHTSGAPTHHSACLSLTSSLTRQGGGASTPHLIPFGFLSHLHLPPLTISQLDQECRTHLPFGGNTGS